MKRPFFALIVTVVGLVVPLTACASSGSSPSAGKTTTPTVTASPLPSSATLAIPAGYRLIGSHAQGVAFAVPRTWVSVNFAQQTLREAISRVGLKGVSTQTLTQALQALQKLHAIYAVDPGSVANSPGHFATNINGYCQASGITLSGGSAIDFAKQAVTAGMQELHAENVTMTQVQVAGVPALQVSYNLSTTGVGTLSGMQLQVLPVSGRICAVTLTTARRGSDTVFRIVKATLQFR